MGDEVLKMRCGNHTGNKQTHNNEATKELKESNYSLLLAEHQHSQKMKVCNAAQHEQKQITKARKQSFKQSFKRYKLTADAEMGDRTATSAGLSTLD